MKRRAGRPIKPPIKRRWKTYGVIPLNQISAIYYRQGGHCANPGCGALMPLYGAGRALEHNARNEATHMICKSCSIVLAVSHRDIKILNGLIQYLQANDKK